MPNIDLFSFFKLWVYLETSLVTLLSTLFVIFGVSAYLYIHPISELDEHRSILRIPYLISILFSRSTHSWKLLPPLGDSLTLHPFSLAGI